MNLFFFVLRQWVLHDLNVLVVLSQKPHHEESSANPYSTPGKSNLCPASHLWWEIARNVAKSLKKNWKLKNHYEVFLLEFVVTWHCGSWSELCGWPFHMANGGRCAPLLLNFTPDILDLEQLRSWSFQDGVPPRWQRLPEGGHKATLGARIRREQRKRKRDRPTDVGPGRLDD